MKTLVRKTVNLCVCLLFCSFFASAQDSRGSYFNYGWKFQRGDVQNAQSITFNDESWKPVTLPHDWSIEGPFSNEWASGTGYLPAGIGWYRKHFRPAIETAGKDVFIYFDGVYKNSEVWINDKYLGKRPNGYASFYHNITPYLKKDGDNVIAVKVDHTDFGDSRWYTGSGINRNVYLLALNPVHTDIWGVAFSTPTVSKEFADVKVVIDVKNSSGKNESVDIISEILSSSGEVVAHAEKKVAAPATGVKCEFAYKVPKPQLWSIDHPQLYRLRTTLRQNGKAIDVVEETVGFRNFSFHPDKGFSLNGEPMKLKGVCFHDDAGALGSAVPRAVWESRLRTLKELGCNAIRMSHNPHQDYLYELCDQLGFLVQDEAFDEWEIAKNKWIAGWNVGTPGKDGYSKYFNEWAERDVKDMILRNRNRTCIIMWSIGNEIDYPNDPYTHEILNTGRNPQIYGRGYQPGYPPAKRLGEIASRLVASVKKYDTTRPVTAALAGVVMSNTTTYPETLDLVGYNYQEYRYEEDHKKYPMRIIYGSENSRSFDAWDAVEKNEFISGQFLWTAFDFMGEARSWPIRSSGAGLIDLAGFPKPEFYHRQSLWSGKPVLRLAVSSVDREPGARRNTNYQEHWNWTPGDSVYIQCYTNAESVELFLSGKSIGSQRRSDSPDKILKWKTVYESGELIARGSTNGKFAQEMKLSTTGKPSKIFAKADKKMIHGNPDDAVEVEISIQDDQGRIVGTATNLLTVAVDGPGRLIGLESGSLSSHEDYKANSREAVGGKLKAYVQGTGRGQIKITVKGANLQPSELSVSCEQNAVIE
jgi:beta-galactosidase